MTNIPTASTQGHPFNVAKTQETLEQRLLRILTSPQPEPKYKLWQQVRHGECVRKYRIVGYYWESVDVVVHNDGLPGWWYVIEGGMGQVNHIPEEDVILVGGSDDRP